MKKVLMTLCTLALVAGTISCKKEKYDVIDPVPVYSEGVYHPVMKIDSVFTDGALSQVWNWVGDNLDKVVAPEGGSTSFNYTGNYISRVSTTGGSSEELRYYYNENNMFSKCEVFYDGTQALTMNLMHNAAGKVSGAEVIVEDNFLLSLASGLLGNGSLFEKLAGRQAAESMITMAKIQHAQNPKISMGNKEFEMQLNWDGDNLSNQVINGNVTITLDTNDLNLISMFIDIPQEYLSLIQLAMMMQGGLPLSLTFNDTIACTYDTNYNPFFCNWGELFSYRNLSLNNALTMTSNGKVAFSVSLMGQSMDLYNYPLNEYAEYQYQYNTKRYPTKVSSDTDIEYIYKK